MNPSPTPLSSSEIQDYKSKTIHDEPLQQSPEGSFKAWCTLIGGFLAITAVFASAQAVSWIGSTQLALMVALGLPAVKLLDLGYFKVLTVIGSTIYVFSIFMLSIAHTSKYYQLFLSQGLAAGLGAGLVYVPVLAVQSHHWRRLRPVAMGIVITSGVRASAFVCLGLLIVANILMTANPPKTRKADPPKLGVLFTDGAYIFGVLGAAVADWGLFFPYFYLQLFAMVKGADPTFSFYLLAIFNGSSIPGRIIPNVLSQKFGVFNTMTFCTFACGILIFGLFGVDNSTRVKDESEIGIRLGLAYCIASLGILTGNPIAGALLGETFPWWRRIVFGAVMLLVGVVLIFITRSIRARQIGSQWV
ncbi:MFS general substrate transporter [Lentinula aciculospora]|uniref:MFS general substrate transporter n=1 Tax=Lentinula aciculospora TaxID=153920 RepID=A0A9W8ZW43_9AGAR|nr:MFS general substrate transporter [Lentinula aciculospora]